MAYWLVKTEEDVYPLAKLKKDKKTLWDGVRNYQARNFLCEMKKGDIVFIYHSNSALLGIVGLAKVSAEKVPDPLQFQKQSDYFDPKASKDSPRWFAPELSFLKQFERPLALDELRKEKDLEDFLLLKKGNRLSVIPVSDTEAQILLALFK